MKRRTDLLLQQHSVVIDHNIINPVSRNRQGFVSIIMSPGGFSVLRVQLQRGVAVQRNCLRFFVAKRTIFSTKNTINSTYRGRNANAILQRYLCVPSSSKKGSDLEDGQVGVGEDVEDDEKAKESSSDNLPIRRIEQDDDDYYDDFESSGSKNSWKRYVSYTFGVSLLGLFGWAGYSLAVELFGRGASNNLFSETFEKVRYNDEILLMTGAPMKAYGQDSGRRSEGRRNHVANR
jgi:hypothetical protein